MCPDAQILIVAFLVLALVASMVYRRLFESISVNFGTLSGILEAPSRRDTFFRTYIEGYYKGRKITFMCPHFDEKTIELFSVDPLRIPCPQRSLILSYPRPTVDTVWKGRKVFYHGTGNFLSLSPGYSKRYGREELLTILETLSLGAERVENGWDGRR